MNPLTDKRHWFGWSITFSGVLLMAWFNPFHLGTIPRLIASVVTGALIDSYMHKKNYQ